MKRLMSQKHLNQLIELLQQQSSDEYDEVLDYLLNVKKHHNALYSVHIDGAICLQRHRAVFESDKLLPIGEEYDTSF